MALVGFIVGFVDFKSLRSVDEIAAALSLKVFGGMKFVEKVVHEDDDIGTLTLEKDFMGIQIDLFGNDGAYTLEIGTRPSASVESKAEVCDLSEMLKQQLSHIPGITIVSGFSGG